MKGPLASIALVLALVITLVGTASAASPQQVQRWDQSAIQISVRRFANLFEHHAKAKITGCHQVGAYGRACYVRTTARDTSCRFTDYARPVMPKMDDWAYWLKGLRCNPS